jgi:hypothetical protein
MPSCCGLLAPTTVRARGVCVLENSAVNASAHSRVRHVRELAAVVPRSLSYSPVVALLFLGRNLEFRAAAREDWERSR